MGYAASRGFTMSKDPSSRKKRELMKRTMYSCTSFVQSLSLFLVLLCAADAFIQRPTSATTTLPSSSSQTRQSIQRPFSVLCLLSNNPDNSNSNNDNEDRLRKLGYSDDEIRRSVRDTRSTQPREEIKVRVDLVDDVDPVSLTAIGFALIALNFLVFANLGDGGISGIVATIINSF
ncbi:hypothetical protein IV203_016961 [Nitzschia inconspicua]|uniref:Uncharacterized protein n=1 Tax=Nitzschia inconspicua TaxID=303405 RepID=A0A9K3KRL6_9STRA|nr:hypothetical protein IV203_017526 [Nitzschia inconspicua]KAG7348256.1 hypothetical protein IV203_016961 [Nitzschia inconspicua]